MLSRSTSLPFSLGHWGRFGWGPSREGGFWCSESQEVGTECSILLGAAKQERRMGGNSESEPQEGIKVYTEDPLIANKTKDQKQLANRRAAQVWMQVEQERWSKDQLNGRGWGGTEHGLQTEWEVLNFFFLNSSGSQTSTELITTQITGSTTRLSDSLGLGWGSRICISDKFPGAILDLGVTLDNHWLKSTIRGIIWGMIRWPRSTRWHRLWGHEITRRLVHGFCFALPTWL